MSFPLASGGPERVWALPKTAQQVKLSFPEPQGQAASQVGETLPVPLASCVVGAGSSQDGLGSECVTRVLGDRNLPSELPSKYLRRVCHLLLPVVTTVPWGTGVQR